jgi:Trk K+ transport system NAD-binding subunit
MAKKKSQLKRIKATIVINPEIWKQTKIRAIELNMEASQFIEEALQKHLEETKPKKE